MQAAPRELCKEGPYANDGTYLAQLLQEQQRPHPMHMRQQYHFMGGPGWINDPNGLVWYKDAYHFFYQYNPFGLTWGEPAGVTR